MSKVSVILPAAGAGRRFGAGRSKIYQQLAGQAVFLRSLELFAGRPDVVQLQLVVAADEREEMARRFGPALRRLGAELAEGGPTRPQSVRNALGRVCGDAELLCVHDAVRPCVAQEWIDRVFAAAAETGAAILACPVRGTLKSVGDDAVVTETVPRAGLWEAQTPQVFARDLLRRAYQRPLEGVTDDAQLVEALGHPVHVVLGDPRNLKITTPGDLALAEAILQTLPADRSP
jgi:2-C-methyl-D-erythritol 4-phosphate cytidylyltransferase